MPDRSALLDRLTAAPSEDTPPTLAARFRASASYRERRSSGAPVEMSAPGVVSGAEIRARLDATAARLRATPGFDAAGSFLTPGASGIQDLALPAPISALVHRQPSTGGQAFLWNQSALTVPADTGVPLGSEGRHVQTDWTKQIGVLVQQVAEATAPLEVFEDSTVLEGFLGDTLERAIFRSIDGEILTGDGSTVGAVSKLKGITSTAGLQSYARVTTGTADYNSDAAARASTLVRNGGWFGDQAFIASPNTIRDTFQQRDSTGAYVDVASACPFIKFWIPTLSLPDGQAIVGDLESAVTLFIRDDGVSVEASQNHYDPTIGHFLTAGAVMLRASMYCYAWVRNVSAVVQVTGLIAS